MYTKFFKTKIENMQLRERIDYGYKKVIIMMLISGILSIAAIGMLFASLVHYVNKINASDIAVKMCRVDINAAARNVREMALNDDISSYDGYEKTIANLLDDVDSQLKIIKRSGVVSKKQYEEYERNYQQASDACPYASAISYMKLISVFFYALKHSAFAFFIHPAHLPTSFLYLSYAAA